MSLRAILSGSRVKKRRTPAPAPAASKKKATTSSAWQPDRLRVTKPSNRPSSTKSSTEDQSPKDFEEADDDEDDGAFSDDADDDVYLLGDSGLVASLANDLSLRDVVQALRHARANMFDPLPRRRTTGEPDDVDSNDVSNASSSYGTGGFVGNSTRIAELLNMRRHMPPLATTAHVAALLPNATATERETVALVRAGILRKVVQPQWRRGFAATGMPGMTTGHGGRGDRQEWNAKDDSRGGGSDSRNRSSADDSGRFRRALAIGGESLGEVLVETAELQKLACEGPTAKALGDDTRAAFAAWLDGGGGGDDGDGDGISGGAVTAATTKLFTINDQPAPQLTAHMIDELVRAGFLVGHGAAAGAVGSLNITGHRSAATVGGGRGRSGERGSHSDTGDVYARPEDRTTLISLETVARAASGSFGAVGGVGAVYTAGGGGARGSGKAASGRRAPVVATEDLALAIPGHGTFVKLVSAALAHVVGLLARTPHREMLETSLRERWDAGGAVARTNGRVGRGGVRRVPLSRAKKWKDFYGLRFDWVLAEALGAGLVELFDTGSVGRGVRLLS